MAGGGQGSGYGGGKGGYGGGYGRGMSSPYGFKPQQQAQPSQIPFNPLPRGPGGLSSTDMGMDGNGFGDFGPGGNVINDLPSVGFKGPAQMPPQYGAFNPGAGFGEFRNPFRGGFYNPFRGGFYNPFRNSPYNPFRGFQPTEPQTMRMPQGMMPINVAGGVPEVMPPDQPPAAMREGGIASLRYQGGGSTKSSDPLDRYRYYRSAQDAYGQTIAMGQSKEYADWYYSLDPATRSYGAIPPATGPDDPNWTYAAEQAKNNYEVFGGTNPWTRQPYAPPEGGSDGGNIPQQWDASHGQDPWIRAAAEDSNAGGTKPASGAKPLRIFSEEQFGGGIKSLKSPMGKAFFKGTKPLVIPKTRPKEGVDGSGDTIDNTPDEEYKPKPSPLGVSGGYKPYTPPPRQVYQPNIYAYKPSEDSQIGQNIPPDTFTALQFKMPQRPGEPVPGKPAPNPNLK